MEGQALLQAILDNPADDLPRLVYADWLEDHGEPERAELIRLMVAHPKFATDKRAKHSPAQMRAAFASAFTLPVERRKWLMLTDIYPNDRYDDSGLLVAVGYPRFVYRGIECVWSRGFIESLSGRLRDLLLHGPAILQEHPVTVILATDLSEHEGYVDRKTGQWELRPGGYYAMGPSVIGKPEEHFDQALLRNIKDTARILAAGGMK